MRKVVTAFAATASLFVVTHQALAQVTVPSQPQPGPFPTSTGNVDGGLLALVWNGSKSIIQWLGLKQSQVDVAHMTDTTADPSGVHLDFGPISGFSSTFGSDTSGISYLIVAAKAGSTNTTNLMLTTALAQPSLTNNGLVGADRQVRDFITNIINNAVGCNSVNPCIANSATDLQYAGTLAGNLFTNTNFTQSAAINSPLLFYSLKGSSTNNIDPVTQAAYTGSLGDGKWLLDLNGRLTYDYGTVSNVPLPAAVWLLLSGLAGVASIGRRKLAA
jgi:hypothetical protein